MYALINYVLLITIRIYYYTLSLHFKRLGEIGRPDWRKLVASWFLDLLLYNLSHQFLKQDQVTSTNNFKLVDEIKFDGKQVTTNGEDDRGALSTITPWYSFTNYSGSGCLFHLFHYHALDRERNREPVLVPSSLAFAISFIIFAWQVMSKIYYSHPFLHLHFHV